MAKKIRKRIPKVKALEAQEYWRLRYLAELMETHRLKKMLAEKESAIIALRSTLCAEKLSQYGDDLKAVESEYQSYRKDLEVKHKVSLENVNIDSTNYTIHGG